MSDKTSYPIATTTTTTTATTTMTMTETGRGGAMTEMFLDRDEATTPTTIKMERFVDDLPTMLSSSYKKKNTWYVVGGRMILHDVWVQSFGSTPSERLPRCLEFVPTFFMSIQEPVPVFFVWRLLIQVRKRHSQPFCFSNCQMHANKR